MSDHGLMHRDGLGDLLTCLPRCGVGNKRPNAWLETAPAATPNAGSESGRPNAANVARTRHWSAWRRPPTRRGDDDLGAVVTAG